MSCCARPVLLPSGGRWRSYWRGIYSNARVAKAAANALRGSCCVGTRDFEETSKILRSSRASIVGAFWRGWPMRRFSADIDLTRCQHPPQSVSEAVHRALRVVGWYVWRVGSVFGWLSRLARCFQGDTPLERRDGPLNKRHNRKSMLCPSAWTCSCQVRTASYDRYWRP
jgi:hypothetical protein